VVRRELSGGALLAMVAHAAGESVPVFGKLPTDTRVVVLVASKEQIAEIVHVMATMTTSSEVVAGYSAILETDGPLTGSFPAVGITTPNREKLRQLLPLLAELKPWSKP